MKTMYLAITVGQEINGRNVVVKIDKASFNKASIEHFLSQNKNSWNENFKFPEGEVTCFFERHAQEVGVEDE
jgi:hypothetical protein